MQDGAPVFHMQPVGMLANRMIQYMVALKFVSLVPDCRISNVHLAEWGIRHPPIDSPGPVGVERNEQHIDLPRLAAAMLAGEIRRVDWLGYGMRMENFLPREQYRDVFRPPAGLHVGFGPEFLVCHVRAGEILDGSAPNYPLIPASFYAQLAEQTGLRPVFIGQTTPNAYTMGLRERLPRAIFREPQDVVVDFETIRQSKNVVVGVSSFAWLAAWLGEADTIVMTVNGLFNPMQYAIADMLPWGDPRYRFWLFPINYAVVLPNHLEAHRRLEPYWRMMPQDVLRRQFTQAPRFRRTLDLMLSAYDERYYVGANRDVADALAAGQIRSGVDHYRGWGFRECRFPFPLNLGWYAARYPMAAFEVAQGDYTDFSHHYLMAGRERGYRPVPPR